MSRIPGLRRTILLAAVSLAALAVLWPIAQDLTSLLMAHRHRSERISHHQEWAAAIADRARAFDSSPGWEGEFRLLLFDLSAWHARRSAAYEMADDVHLDDEDITDQLGLAALGRQVQEMRRNQPTNY